MADLAGSFYKKPAPRVPTAEAPDAMGVGAVERRMLRELLPTKTVATAAATAGDAAAGGKKDDPLVVTLLTKVQTLEDQNARLRSMIIDKEKEVFALKRAAAEAASAGSAEDAALLADENERLRRQICDMEAFLRDYGLVWIGPRVSSRSSRPPSPLEAVAAVTAAAAGAPPAKPAAAAPPPAPGAAAAAAAGWPEIDFPVLLLRLQQLNELVGAGKARVVKGRDGAHRLEVPTGFPLTIYRNGFMLGRGPFRSYAEDSARAFIQDVMDGYFPSELKASHPDGLVMDVRDASGKDFVSDDHHAAATGIKGFTVLSKGVAASSSSSGGGGSSNGSSSGAGAMPVPPPPLSSMPVGSGGGDPRAASAIRTLADLGDASLPMSLPEFISALPTTVISGGNVIRIREGVAAMLDGKHHAHTTAGGPHGGGAPAGGLDGARAETETRGDRSATVVAAVDMPIDDATPLATVQVRSADGSQTLVVRLPASATIGDLRRNIATHRTTAAAFELRTAYPRRLLSDTTQTLQAACLAPTGVLHLVSV